MRVSLLFSQLFFYGFLLMRRLNSNFTTFLSFSFRGISLEASTPCRTGACTPYISLLAIRFLLIRQLHWKVRFVYCILFKLKAQICTFIDCLKRAERRCNIYLTGLSLVWAAARLASDQRSKKDPIASLPFRRLLLIFLTVSVIARKSSDL